MMRQDSTAAELSSSRVLQHVLRAGAFHDKSATLQISTVPLFRWNFVFKSYLGFCWITLQNFSSIGEQRFFNVRVGYCYKVALRPFRRRLTATFCSFSTLKLCILGALNFCLCYLKLCKVTSLKSYVFKNNILTNSSETSLESSNLMLDMILYVLR